MPGLAIADDGTVLTSYTDEEANNLELKRHSPHDADSMHRFQADLGRYAQLIRKTLLRTPPDPTSFKPRDIREFLFLAKEFWALGEKELYEYVRFFTMSAADFLEDYFENDLIKAAMASPGIIGTALGVYSPGSSYILLHHVMGDVDGNVGAWGLARGGMGAISDAIAGAVQEHGGEIRTEAGVQQILVENGKVIGVVLENGDEIRSRIVVSNLDAKRTFTQIMDERDLPADIVRRAKNFKIRGSSGKVNIALSGMPKFTGVPDNRYINRGGQGFSGSLETMERAYDSHTELIPFVRCPWTICKLGRAILNEIGHPVLAGWPMDTGQTGSVRYDCRRQDRTLQSGLQRSHRAHGSSNAT